jgi:lactate dehydrogenase-like 2-hydroxyacid dehydrogenase
MALGLMLASRRRLLEADALVRRGDWEKAVRKDPIFSRDLTRSTLGIVGCGRIGREVAKRARAFDMTLLYTQRTRLDEAVEREYGLTYCTLEELMQRSDIVSIHTPLTPATRGLIGAEELAASMPGSTSSPTSPRCRASSSTFPTSCLHPMPARPPSRPAPRWPSL